MSLKKTFDVAVLGLGTMGAFACLEAVRRKASVIGFDRFHPPHERGSHSGDTRVFREAYGEFINYVPLAQHAGRMWDELGAEAGQIFLHRRGMLNVGPKASVLISGVQASARRWSLALEELSAGDIRHRFPGFAPEEDYLGVFEPGAGWVEVNPAIEFAFRRAAALGANLHFDSPVDSFVKEGDGFRIQSKSDIFFARNLVFAAGAGSSGLLSDLQLPLKVIRKTLIWVKPLKPELFTPDRFPVFSFSDKFLYGFPSLDHRGVKIAVHWDTQQTPTSIDILQPEVTDAEKANPLNIAAKVMPDLCTFAPAALANVSYSKPCLYTMTPDEGFLLDRYENLDNAYIATGFSGHGFKFAPAIGAALADLALTGKTVLPVGSMSRADRF